MRASSIKNVGWTCDPSTRDVPQGGRRARAALPRWRVAAALVTTFAVLAAARMVTARGATRVDHTTAVGLLDFHLRASQRAQEDARRCARELRALATRHPAVAARALEIDAAAMTAAGGVAALPTLTSQAIEMRVTTVEDAVEHIAQMARSVPPRFVPVSHVAGARLSDVALSEVGDTTARARRAADTLCEVREVVSAATLEPPVLTRERLTGVP